MAQTGNPYNRCARRAAARKNYNCEQDTEQARISDVAFVEKGVIAKGLTGPALIAALLAAELACKGFILRNVAGSYDGGTPTTGKGRGRQKETTTGRRHVVTFTDFEFTGNEDFWNTIEDNQLNYDFFNFTGSHGRAVQDRDLRINPKGAITDDPEANVEGEIEVSWSAKGIPVSFPAPVEDLQEMPFLAYTGLTNEAGSAATIAGDTITIANAATMDVKATFTGADTYVLADGSPALPAWLTLTEAGHLTGTAPAGDSTVTLVLRGLNGCGIAGEAEVTVTVA